MLIVVVQKKKMFEKRSFIDLFVRQLFIVCVQLDWLIEQ